MAEKRSSPRRRRRSAHERVVADLAGMSLGDLVRVAEGFAAKEPEAAAFFHDRLRTEVVERISTSAKEPSARPPLQQPRPNIREA